MKDVPAQAPRRWLLTALLLQRCPRCREGKMFRGTFTMNDLCPVCGMVFEREQGYFFGAMYFSYALAVAILTPLFFFLQWLQPDWPGPVVVLLAMALYLPLVPAVFRYARVLWTYFDRAGAPSDLTSHAGWSRWREAGQHEDDPDKP